MLTEKCPFLSVRPGTSLTESPLTTLAAHALPATHCPSDSSGIEEFCLFAYCIFVSGSFIPHHVCEIFSHIVE